MALTEGTELPDLHSVRSSGFQEGSQESLHSRRGLQRQGEQEQVPLAQADGGRQAWMFLLGSFFIEGLTWGFPLSFGVFQDYYENHLPFSKEPAGITAIGTTATGVMYLSAPILSTLLSTFPSQRRRCSFVGLVIIIIALVSSSFADRIWHLILTQGVMYAVGGSMLYYPTVLFLDEWFIRRKGFAYGVMWAGTGAAGACIPFIMSWGLNKYSFATMLRAWAVVLAILTGPLLIHVKPRIPLTGTFSHPRRLDFSFLKSRTFWALQTGNILESVGFFMPGIWLPTYARALGLSPFFGTLPVALFNTSSVFGTILMGSLTDRFHVTSVILLCTAGATLSVFLLWGMATNLPLLCIFSLCYGVTAGGFSSTWPGMIKEVKKKSERAEVSMLFGLYAAGRGVGSVISGPLSEALVHQKPWTGKAAMGYGTGYGVLILFTGVSAALGAVPWIGRRTGMI